MTLEGPFLEGCQSGAVDLDRGDLGLHSYSAMEVH